jgi:hypothetical protein
MHANTHTHTHTHTHTYIHTYSHSSPSHSSPFYGMFESQQWILHILFCSTTTGEEAHSSKDMIVHDQHSTHNKH